MHSDAKSGLARLFNVNTDAIDLQTIDWGLSHQSYICRVYRQAYFAKVYRLAGNACLAVAEINRLTNYMRSRGVPAPRVVLYSPRFPNIVVHEFAEGEIVSGDISQIKAISQLYSRVALIGTENGKLLSKPEYLETINGCINTIEGLGVAGLDVDASIQAGH